MAFRHRSSDTLHLVALPDVAHLELRAELVGQRAQSILAAREQHHVPATRCERAGDRLPDSARGARNDGDAFYRQTLTPRVPESVRPDASVAVALSTCRPGSARRVLQDPVKTSAPPLPSMSICFPSTKKRTVRIF